MLIQFRFLPTVFKYLLLHAGMHLVFEGGQLEQSAKLLKILAQLLLIDVVAECDSALSGLADQCIFENFTWPQLADLKFAQQLQLLLFHSYDRYVSIDFEQTLQYDPYRLLCIEEFKSFRWPNLERLFEPVMQSAALELEFAERLLDLLMEGAILLVSADGQGIECGSRGGFDGGGAIVYFFHDLVVSDDDGGVNFDGDVVDGDEE